MPRPTSARGSTISTAIGRSLARTSCTAVAAPVNPPPTMQARFSVPP
jgi:hypothetical protein